MSLLSSVRPVDWPSPYSRAGRALGWVHFVVSIITASVLQVAGLICFIVGALAAVVVVALAVPVAGVVGLGWLARRGARRLLPPS